jgi:acyl carrier protein/GNAT superfamily N-acetyltransferase
MKNTSSLIVFISRIKIAFKLLKKGKANIIWKGIRTCLYSNKDTFGLLRDLDIVFESTNAKIDFTIRLFKDNDINTLKESYRHERLVKKNISSCFVAVTKENIPCYRQWLIGSQENIRIKKYFGNLFPKLKENEALMEGAFTHPSFRGIGIMPAAMSRIAEKGKDVGASKIITFVDIDNIPSLRSCKESGFAPYILRKEKWLFFRRSVSFGAIPNEMQTLYSKYTADRPNNVTTKSVLNTKINATLTKIEIKNKIRDYIIKSTFDNVKNITDKTLIFEEGVLDSMGLLFLIEFLKEEFNVTTNDDELVVKNFESINNIVAFLNTKL